MDAEQFLDALASGGGVIALADECVTGDVVKAKEAGCYYENDLGIGFCVVDGSETSPRERLLEDLLCSALCIAERKGEQTNWEAFANRLKEIKISNVTPRTFRMVG